MSWADECNGVGWMVDVPRLHTEMLKVAEIATTTPDNDVDDSDIRFLVSFCHRTNAFVITGFDLLRMLTVFCPHY